MPPKRRHGVSAHGGSRHHAHTTVVFVFNGTNVCIGRVICHAFSNSPAMGQYSQYENLARIDQYAWICVAQSYRIQANQQ